MNDTTIRVRVTCIVAVVAVHELQDTVCFVAIFTCFQTKNV